MRAFAMLGGRHLLLPALVWGVTGCEAELGEPLEQVRVDVMSFNLAGAAGDRAELVSAHIADVGPQFVAAQECYACEDIVANLPPYYRVAAEPRNGVTILFDDRDFAAVDTDAVALAGDDDGWGVRYAVRSSFEHRVSGGIFTVVSTHWCVPIRNDVDDCDDGAHLDYAERTIDAVDFERAPAETVVIAGDFNVFGQFERAPALDVIRSAGFRDVFRELNPSDPGPTFGGNDWAPEGRLDYIFAAAPLTAHAATLERGSIATPTGSDHIAVTATLEWSGLR